MCCRTRPAKRDFRICASSKPSMNRRAAELSSCCRFPPVYGDPIPQRKFKWIAVRWTRAYFQVLTTKSRRTRRNTKKCGVFSSFLEFSKAGRKKNSDYYLRKIHFYLSVFFVTLRVLRGFVVRFTVAV